MHLIHHNSRLERPSPGIFESSHQGVLFKLLPTRVPSYLWLSKICWHTARGCICQVALQLKFTFKTSSVYEVALIFTLPSVGYRYTDRVPYFSYFTLSPFQSQTTNISTFVRFRHTVTILVTAITYPTSMEKGNY